MTLEACKQAIKPLCAHSMQEAYTYFSNLAIPLGSLGRLQDTIIQLAGVQRCVTAVYQTAYRSSVLCR